MRSIYHPPQVDIILKVYHPFRKERISLKKGVHFREVLFSGSFELNDTNSKRLNFTDFSLHFYYNIKKHSLQYKNAESSLEIYNGNAKQTPAKLQPLSNNIFS